MKNSTKTLVELVAELPPEYHDEVKDFMEFLIDKRGRKKGTKLRQDWAGALKEYKHKYTSLELQKKALKWWGD
ncbi:MAG: DUF2281 domain-containing protein [bacterium]